MSLGTNWGEKVINSAVLAVDDITLKSRPGAKYKSYVLGSQLGIWLSVIVTFNFPITTLSGLHLHL